MTRGEGTLTVQKQLIKNKVSMELETSLKAFSSSSSSASSSSRLIHMISQQQLVTNTGSLVSSYIVVLRQPETLRLRSFNTRFFGVFFRLPSTQRVNCHHESLLLLLWNGTPSCPPSPSALIDTMKLL